MVNNSPIIYTVKLRLNLRQVCSHVSFDSLGPGGQTLLRDELYQALCPILQEPFIRLTTVKYVSKNHDKLYSSNRKIETENRSSYRALMGSTSGKCLRSLVINNTNDNNSYFTGRQVLSVI